MRFRFPSWLLAIAVIGMLVGCGAPRQAVLPGGDAAAGLDAAGHEVVQPGDVVRVQLRSGRATVGEVVTVDPDSLVLGRSGNFGYETESIPADRIVRIELDAGETGGSAALKVGGILGLVVVAFALGMLVSGGWGLN